jgi:hypothetical protein
MLEAFIGITVALFVATGAFWLIVCCGRRRKHAKRYYFLPWLLSVVGLSLVGFQLMHEAIDIDDAVYAVMLIVGLVWGLVYAKSQVTCRR